MQAVSLNGDWTLLQPERAIQVPASVPGDVHTSLMVAAVIPDPFYRDNELKVAWVAETDWAYTRQFEVTPELMDHEKVLLTCDGLDTIAEVTLNGHHLGDTDNMFRQYRWDVKPLLHEGENQIKIIFRSPIEFTRKKMVERPLYSPTASISGGSYLRKAPCQFGWDWGPKLLPIGIWKDITLVGYHIAHLDDVHIHQHHQGDDVSLEIQAKVKQWGEVSITLLVHLTAPDGTVIDTQNVLEGENGKVHIDIKDPALWYPNGYGSQPLYTLNVSLSNDGKELDSRQYMLGLRTIELRQEEDTWGQSFTFVVNGIPIFAKGANWIPADSFPTRLSDAHMEKLLKDSADVHMNMLRVWGGGFYESELFYDLCDRYGILVWQDMVFSCSIYPLNDPSFIDNLHEEIKQNIRRLRHRASLALWCGDNEMEMGWVEWGWDTPELTDLKAAYEGFFYHTLKAWVAEEDPDRSYWPSSPSSNDPFDDPDGHQKGDAHFWEVWHGLKPFTAYHDVFPRFMSEFGFQAFPPLPTIQAYTEEEDRNLSSYVMDLHQRSYRGNGIIIGQMMDNFCLPKDFESMIYMSMVLQAEGIRYGVEHWRRHMDRVSGTLYWQLNDCWPVASWASLDYFGRWKALHYAAKKFYAPLMLSLLENGNKVEVHLTSDLQTEKEVEIKWWLETLDGEVLESGNQTLTVSPLGSQKVETVVCSFPPGSERDVVFICDCSSAGTLIDRKLTTFVPNKYLALKDPGVEIQISEGEGGALISVSAPSLARFVELSLDSGDTVFSDNYFDVPPGRSVKISCPLPEDWDIYHVKKALNIQSLYHSYTTIEKTSKIIP